MSWGAADNVRRANIVRNLIDNTIYVYICRIHKQITYVKCKLPGMIMHTTSIHITYMYTYIHIYSNIYIYPGYATATATKRETNCVCTTLPSPIHFIADFILQRTHVWPQRHIRRRGPSYSEEYIVKYSWADRLVLSTENTLLRARLDQMRCG